MSSTANDIASAIVIQITARVPAELIASLDMAAAKLNRSRADVVRQAIAYYVAHFEDLSKALHALNDPADPVLDWKEVKRALLGQDQGKRR
jgi:RHH-type transcriptional regulator, rel operon repressor / antitoxin RelB